MSTSTSILISTVFANHLTFKNNYYNMGCFLLNTEESKKAVKDLAAKLSTSDADTPKYEKIAYYLLSANGGNTMDLDMNGNPSRLYEDLLLEYNGDERAAILSKGYIYTSQFAYENGEWMETTMLEPSITQLKKHGQIVQEFFPNSNYDLIATEVDRMLCNRLLNSFTSGSDYLSQAVDKERQLYIDDYMDHAGYNLAKEDADNILSLYDPEERERRTDEVVSQCEWRLRNIARRYFAYDKIKRMIDSFSEDLYSLWGMEKYKDENGYVDQISSTDVINEDDLFNFKSVIQFRINLLRYLQDVQIDENNFLFFHNLVSDIIDQSDKLSAVEGIIRHYFEFNKDSKAVISICKNTGLVQWKDGKPTDKSLGEAIQKISQQINQEMSDFSGNRKKESKLLKFYRKLKRFVIFASSFASSNSTAIGSAISTCLSAGVLRFTDTTLFNTALIGAGSYALWKTGAYLIHKAIGTDIKTYETLRNGARKLILASAMNYDLLNYTVNENEYLLMRNIITPYVPNASNRVLRNIRDILHSLLVAIKTQSRKEQDGYEKYDRDIDNITDLISLCDEALATEDSSELKSTRVNTFYHRYLVEYMLNSLDDAISTLSAMDNSPESIDERELMRIKTDVVGAFNNAVSNQIVPNILQLSKQVAGFGEGGRFLKIVDGVIANNIEKARTLLNTVLFKYCDSIIDKTAQDHFGSTVKEDKLETLKLNLKQWLRNEIGSNSSFDIAQNVMSAKHGKSPLISMLVQKLEEIETKVQKESDETGSDLLNKYKQLFNAALRELSPINILNRYAERDSDGLFTGFFKSKVKRGQYFKDRKAVIDRLVTKHGLARDEKNNDVIIWDNLYSEKDNYQYMYIVNGKPSVFTVVPNSEDVINTDLHVLYLDRWQAFQMDLVLWQAGADFDSNGNLVIKEGSVKRVHRRHNFEYYLLKFKYLNKDDCDILSDYNQRIAKIDKKCTETITVNGKKVRVPIRSKLSPQDRKNVAQLVAKKNQLSCMYEYFLDDETGTKIVSIKDKSSIGGSETERKRTLRFLYYDKAKSEYIQEYKAQVEKQLHQLRNLRMLAVSEEEIKDIDKKIQAISPNADLYNSVLQHFDDLIDELSSKLEEETDENIIEDINNLINTLKFQKNLFLSDNTTIGLTDLFKLIVKDRRIIHFDVFNQKLVEFLQLTKSYQLLKNQLRSSNERKTLDLKRVKGNTKQDTKNLWLLIVNLCQQIEDARHDIVDLLQEDVSEDGKLDSSHFFDRMRVPLLDENERETSTTFINHLVSTLGISKNDLKITNPDTGHHEYAQIFKMSVPNADIIDLLVDKDGNKQFEKTSDIFTHTPGGMFSGEAYPFKDDDFDEDSIEYVLINGNRPEYDNKKEFKEIENDTVYNTMLHIMDMVFENMPGITRRSRYSLPLVLADASQMYARAFTQGKHGFRVAKDTFVRSLGWWKDFDTRDVDVNEHVITKSDGTVVEVIPTRFISKLSDSNMVSTDLIGSVIDMYTESLRYKYRCRKQAMFDAFLFALSGGYNTTSDAVNTQQADLLRSEMSKSLYGRDIIGSGVNGRLLPEEKKLAVMSKRIRSVLHTRLMANNDLSAMKNGFDSFCNVWTAGYDRRWYTTSNIISGIGKLASNFGSAIYSLYDGHARNMSLGFLHRFGVDCGVSRRFYGLNKSRTRRIIAGTSDAKFAIIDYTAKAVATEAILHNYRFLYNPKTKKFEFLTLAECERVYNTPVDGYKAWKKSKDASLRSMYTFNKETNTTEIINRKIKIKNHTHGGVYEFNPQNVIDDKLEARVRAHIREATSYINGMLDKEDKPSVARHWLGALFTSYRGWMVVRQGEDYKNGSDFYQQRKEEYDANFVRRFFGRINELFKPKKDSGFLDDDNYKGKASWSTGLIGTGYHRGLISAVMNHLATAVPVILIPGLAHMLKIRYQSNITQNDMLKITHFAANILWFLFTILMTVYAYGAVYGDGDGDDEKDTGDSFFPKWMRAKIYAALVASISERFTSIGRITFLLNVSDIVKSFSVASTLFDDSVFILESLNTINDFFSDTPYEDTDSGTKLTNGGFGGKTKGQRNITRALALTGINPLPGLVTLDALNYMGAFGDNFEDVTFRDYCLNYYKYHNEKPALSSAKWYGTLLPVPYVNKVTKSAFDSPIIKEGKSKKEKNTSNVLYGGRRLKLPTHKIRR